MIAILTMNLLIEYQALQLIGDRQTDMFNVENSVNDNLELKMEIRDLKNTIEKMKKEISVKIFYFVIKITL